MIFADANEGTLAAVGLSLITMIGGAIALGINATKERRMVRDKMELDAKVVQLQSDHKNCQEDHATVVAELKEVRVELKSCRDEHAIAYQERDKLWEAVHKLEKRK